ncbi:hypothetical protein [Halomonas sp. 3A7M]|uniref:hypothetical protein n=1 Tax=Halomonas sp. 3A7M TaxID=2742616 RepID=UPI0018685438|nr:hypothetical protein [Halomonas sp. 3A7M]
MNRHAVFTDETIDDAVLLAALEAAGIVAQVKPLHLQRAAGVAAEIVAEYPIGQQGNARDNLIAWIDEALDTADDARLKLIADSIDYIKRNHGELATWRCKGGYIALQVPTAFVSSIVNVSSDARRAIELRQLTGLMLPQLHRIAPEIMKSFLGDEYAGNNGDYERLMLAVCRDLAG